MLHLHTPASDEPIDTDSDDIFTVTVARKAVGGRATYEIDHADLKAALEETIRRCAEFGWLPGLEIPPDGPPRRGVGRRAGPQPSRRG